MVAYKVSSDGLPGAGLRDLLIGHCDPISGVVEVQKYNIKHQRRLSWDVAAWREKKKTGGRQEGVEDDMNYRNILHHSSSNHDQDQFPTLTE